MNKITINNYEELNQKAIEKYIQGQHAVLNEYFYIQDTLIIQNLLNRINEIDCKRTPKDEAEFLTGFFWNQSNSDYTLAENYGKFFLRLGSFKDDNTLIEIKELLLEEQINFIHNLEYITNKNSYLKNLFQLENKRLFESIVENIQKTETLEKIKELFCMDWIEKNDMMNVIEHNLKLMRNLDLYEKLNQELKPRNIMKKHKI